MAEVNCVPLSEVSCAGTPYLEIQPVMRASAQLVAAMSRMGRASGQREDLFTTVKGYLLPQVATGRGPTMSTWMWVKRLAGMAMGCTATMCCLEALALSHCWQFLTHAATSLLRLRHITLAGMSCLMARMPAWASPWKAANMAGLSTSGTSGLTPPLEMTQRSSRPPTTRFSTCRDVEEAAPLCEWARSLMGGEGGIIDHHRGRSHGVDLRKRLHWSSQPALRG
jgi:hypothetical protein